MPTERRKESVDAVIRAYLDGQIAYTRDARVKNGRVETRTVQHPNGRDFTLYRNGVRMASYFLPTEQDAPKTVYVVRNTTLVPDLVRILKARGWTKVVAGLSFGDMWEAPVSGTGQTESPDGRGGADQTDRPGERSPGEDDQPAA